MCGAVAVVLILAANHMRHLLSIDLQRARTSSVQFSREELAEYKRYLQSAAGTSRKGNRSKPSEVMNTWRHNLQRSKESGGFLDTQPQDALSEYPNDSLYGPDVIGRMDSSGTEKLPPPPFSDGSLGKILRFSKDSPELPIPLPRDYDDSEEEEEEEYIPSDDSQKDALPLRRDSDDSPKNDIPLPRYSDDSQKEDVPLPGDSPENDTLPPIHPDDSQKNDVPLPGHFGDSPKDDPSLYDTVTDDAEFPKDLDQMPKHGHPFPLDSNDSLDKASPHPRELATDANRKGSADWLPKPRSSLHLNPGGFKQTKMSPVPKESADFPSRLVLPQSKDSAGVESKQTLLPPSVDFVPRQVFPPPERRVDFPPEQAFPRPKDAADDQEIGPSVLLLNYSADSVPRQVFPDVVPKPDLPRPRKNGARAKPSQVLRPSVYPAGFEPQQGLPEHSGGFEPKQGLPEHSGGFAPAVVAPVRKDTADYAPARGMLLPKLPPSISRSVQNRAVSFQRNLADSPKRGFPFPSKGRAASPNLDSESIPRESANLTDKTVLRYIAADCFN